MYNSLVKEIIQATFETIYMVGVSSLIATLIGIPLGMILFSCKSITVKRKFYQAVNSLIGLFRSIPFIILLVLLLPLTRLLVGTSIGSTATLVPLSIAAIPFVAKLTENIFNELPYSLIEAGISIGATGKQILVHILFPDALPALIQTISVTIINLIAYSAMAGAVGGGGLGDLAIRYGYQRFDFLVLILTVILLVVMVQGVQWLGDKLAKSCSH